MASAIKSVEYVARNTKLAAVPIEAQVSFAGRR